MGSISIGFTVGTRVTSGVRVSSNIFGLGGLGSPLLFEHLHAHLHSEMSLLRTFNGSNRFTGCGCTGIANGVCAFLRASFRASSSAILKGHFLLAGCGSTGATVGA